MDSAQERTFSEIAQISKKNHYLIMLIFLKLNQAGK